MNLRLALLAAAFLAPLSARAETLCVVDPETLEIRDHLISTDNEYLLPTRPAKSSNGSPTTTPDRS